MTSRLKIFVAEDCPGCVEARAIATHIEQTYPNLYVEIIDINNDPTAVPEKVFATPTYILDDRVVSLGNPGLEDITHWANGTT
jgi:alanine dehydrogenase